MVSVFGRRADVEGPDGYVFFAADSQHPHYELVKNVVNSRTTSPSSELNDYPVTAEDILHTGPEAFDAALNTVNIGKFNLGWASIGICTHAFYEAITHADEPRPLRHARDRLPARAPGCSPTPTRGWSR